MFPGKTGHGRGPRPASYGSAERARARRRLGFLRPEPADALGGYSTGLGDGRTACSASRVLPAARAGAAQCRPRRPYPCPDPRDDAPGPGACARGTCRRAPHASAVAVAVSAAGFVLAWWVCQKWLRLDVGVSLGIAGAGPPWCWRSEHGGPPGVVTTGGRMASGGPSCRRRGPPGPSTRLVVTRRSAKDAATSDR